MFSRRKGKDGKSKKKGANTELDQQPAKPRWTDAWARNSVEPEEVHELVKRCTEEIKSRGTPSISPRERQIVLHPTYAPDPLPPGLRQHLPGTLCRITSIAMKADLILLCSSRPTFPASALPTDVRPQCCAYIHTPLLRQLCTPWRDLGAGATDGRAHGTSFDSNLPTRC